MASATVVSALRAALTTSWTAAPVSGCGRAYVCFSEPRAVCRAVEAACKELDGIAVYLRKAYGTAGEALYIGYDNADGRALGRAKAVSESLNAAGFRTYVDAVED